MVGWSALGWEQGCWALGSGTYSPPITLSVPAPQHQEHLSSTLAALRSNQITLKVCRFWKFFRPLSAKRLSGHRAQHCTFPGPTVRSGELWVQQLAVKVAMTWLPSPQLAHSQPWSPLALKLIPGASCKLKHFQK